MPLPSIEILTALGFDLSVPTGVGTAVVGCSKCDAVVVNGVPTHESSCPNRRHECKGCSTLIPANQTYCGECMS